MSIPSNDWLLTSAAISEAEASRDADVARTVAATEPSKLSLTRFWMVGMRSVPVMAARQVAFSAFQFFRIVPSPFQLYQTGFDSVSAPAFSWADFSAPAFQGGIHAVSLYAANDEVARNSTNAAMAAVRNQAPLPCDPLCRSPFRRLKPRSAVQPSGKPDLELCDLPSPGVCLCRAIANFR